MVVVRVVEWRVSPPRSHSLDRRQYPIAQSYRAPGVTELDWAFLHFEHSDVGNRSGLQGSYLVLLTDCSRWSLRAKGYYVVQAQAKVQEFGERRRKIVNRPSHVVAVDI